MRRREGEAQAVKRRASAKGPWGADAKRFRRVGYVVEEIRCSFQAADRVRSTRDRGVRAMKRRSIIRIKDGQLVLGSGRSW